MLPPTRREKIELMLSQKPTDAMLRYMLAMELDKESQHDRSLEVFRTLMHDTRPYVPAFLMAGQQLTRLGRLAEAREVLRTGVEEARAQGDAHAAGEMSEFLTGLGKMGE